MHLWRFLTAKIFIYLLYYLQSFIPFLVNAIHLSPHHFESHEIRGKDEVFWCFGLFPLYRILHQLSLFDRKIVSPTCRMFQMFLNENRNVEILRLCFRFEYVMVMCDTSNEFIMCAYWNYWITTQCFELSADSLLRWTQQLILSG